jgi:DNA (cytosine-5)-methyltransferase 1
MKRPIAIDLFRGCGGLTLGLRQAGFRVVGAVENDPLAVETYRANHKGVAVWPEDIRTLTPCQVKRHLGLRKGELDLLAGCPPCQGFSTMTTLNGKRAIADSRNDLVFEFLRFVRGLAPKAVMLENVPGLAKDARIRRVCRQLKALGYEPSLDVLDAAEYGVPQRRRRMILLAARNAVIPFARPARRMKTVRDALTRLCPGRARNDPLHQVGEKRSAKVTDIIRLIPKNGGSRLDLGERRQLDCHRNCDGFNDVYGRMAWDEVAPTITGGCCNPSKGRFLHPTKNRCITLREAALLQTLPPSCTFSTKRGIFPAAQMIGNALPSVFIRRHADAVLDHLLPTAATAELAKESKADLVGGEPGFKAAEKELLIVWFHRPRFIAMLMRVQTKTTTRCLSHDER